MTHRQARSLAMIWQSQKTRPEGLHLKELAGQLGVTVASASVLVETMVKKNLFIRTHSDIDRRAVCIRLTKSGEKTLGAIVRNRSEYSRLLLDGVDPADKAVFLKVIRYLCAKLSEPEQPGEGDLSEKRGEQVKTPLPSEENPLFS